MLAFEFTFGHVGSQVVVSEEYDIAQLHFDIKQERYLWSSQGGVILATILWKFCSFYMCVLRLCFWGKSNIALFALKFTFGHIEGDTFEAVKEEQFWSRRFCCFYKGVLWLSLEGAIWWTLLPRFCYLHLCVLRLCFWTNVILLCLHLDFHLVPKEGDTFNV